MFSIIHGSRRAVNWMQTANFNTLYLHFCLTQKLNSKHVNCKWKTTNILEIMFSGTHSKESWQFWPIKLSTNFSSSNPLQSFRMSHEQTYFMTIYLRMHSSPLSNGAFYQAKRIDVQLSQFCCNKRAVRHTVKCFLKVKKDGTYHGTTVKSLVPVVRGRQSSICCWPAW